MLDTPLQDKHYNNLYVYNACGQSCIMMIMGVSKNRLLMLATICDDT